MATLYQWNLTALDCLLDEGDVKAYFRKISFTSEHPTLSTADALRTLASTIRMRLLGHLQLEGDATATECGLAVGESASACSYHLRQLAKHGFVEEVASGDGRERRWRARVVGFDFPAGDEGDEDLQAASQLARAALLELTDGAVRA
jgi:DNA-binding transcriptional ArsR family regulator